MYNVTGLGSVNSANTIFNDIQNNGITKSYINGSKPDLIELSTKKDKKSNYKNILLGCTAALGTIFAGLLLHKNLSEKFYVDNIKKIQIPENLQLPEFTTREDAVQFAIKTLKINEIEEDVSFDALKDVLNAIVNISNKNKGQFFNTNKITLCKEEDTIASVGADCKAINFGQLSISENLYNNEHLDIKLKQLFFNKNGERLKCFEDILKNNNTDCCIIIPGKLENSVLSEDFTNLIKKYYNSPQNLTLKEKQNLYLSWLNFLIERSGVSENPIVMLKKIKDVNSGLFEAEGLSLEEISKKTNEEQINILEKLLTNYKNKGVVIKNQYNVKTIEDSIYHEFGHLQDLMSNKSKLTDYEFNLSRRMTKSEFEELEKKENVKYKRHEFQTNVEEQNIAEEVSWYATESVGEFIAETYAKLIKGYNVSDEVIALYKKYNGPMLNS